MKFRLLLSATLILTACQRIPHHGNSISKLPDNSRMYAQTGTPNQPQRGSYSSVPDCSLIEKWNRSSTLDELYAAPGLQEFTIFPHRDTVLYGKKGTSLSFKKGTFNYDNVHKKRVIKPITVRLREYYNVADFLFSPLTTQTSEGIIETGGSVYLEAFCGEDSVVIAEGKSIEIGFPVPEIATEQVTDMRTFYGFQNADQQIRWETEIEAQKIFKDDVGYLCDIRVMDERFFELQLKGGYNTLINMLSEVLKDSSLRPEGDRGGVVSFSFVVPGRGYTMGLKKTSGINPVLDSALSALVAGIYWEPEENSRFDKRMGQQIWFTFKEANRNNYKHALLFEDTFVDSVSKYTVKVGMGPDELMRYQLPSKNLNYVNCDRFSRDPGPKVDVFIPMADNTPGVLNVVFKKEKIVMKGYRVKDGLLVRGVPEGKQVTVVAMRESGGSVETANVSAKAGESFELEYQKMDAAPLIAALESSVNWSGYGF